MLMSLNLSLAVAFFVLIGFVAGYAYALFEYYLYEKSKASKKDPVK